jgi:dihydrofolate reductase
MWFHQGGETPENAMETIDRFGIVAAMSKNRVIGIHGGIPWRLPKDREIFKSLTNRRILIIGRRTFEEHPNLVHVNHTKVCIVVSKSMDDVMLADIMTNTHHLAPDTTLKLVRSFPEALQLAKSFVDESVENCENDDVEALECWVAGGEKIYEEALQHPSATEIHLSVVDTEIDVTRGGESIARFPSTYRWDHIFKQVSQKEYPETESSLRFKYYIYNRIKRRN